MPRSAVAAGHVDRVLPPAKIARELTRLARSLSAPNGRREINGGNGLKKILDLLRSHCGVDFEMYKASTIQRRIQRRMLLHRINRAETYFNFLRDHPKEIETLYGDVLVNTTGFFREPEVFQTLGEKVFPQLVRKRAAFDPVRVWVLGCSTGQEAYSIAMSYLEFAARTRSPLPLQLFASDLNEQILEKARAGLYSKNQVAEISPERLRRFFVEEEGGYRVSKSVRELCVFARHNVLYDPPFSRMDMVSCRNLLMYLDPQAEKTVVPTLHYSLKPSGFLLLGAGESLKDFPDLFQAHVQGHRVYAKQNPPARPSLLPVSSKPKALFKPKPLLQPPHPELNAQQEADQLVLAKYGPAGVIVNANGNIVQFRGQTGPYLEAMPGKASLNILKMARDGLLAPLRTALLRAKADHKSVRREGIDLHGPGQPRQINLEVIPLKAEQTYLVLFEPVTSDHQRPETELRAEEPRSLKAAKQEIVRARTEIKSLKEYLHSVIEQYEAGSEELRVASQESLSSNEELQSINE